MKKRTLKRMEAIAGSEFSIVGENDYAFGGGNYVGAGEFDFDGKLGSTSSFAAELAGSRPYQLTIENTYPTVKAIAICPGMYTTVAQLAAAGITGVDAILNDGVCVETSGVGAITATASQSNQSIYTLREFVKRNPSRITHMTLQSNVQAQFEQVMTLQVVDPFSRNGSKPLLLTDFYDVNQQRTEKITVNLLSTDMVIDMNDQNVAILPLAASSKLVLTLRIGGILNPAKQLKTAATVAHGNIRSKHPHVYSR